MSEVKLFLIKSKDTWMELSCSVDDVRKCLMCEDGKEYPLKSLKKVIYVETKGLIRKSKEIKHYYVQLVTSNTKVVDIDVEGTFSELEDPNVIENAIAEGLRRAMERPSKWWEILMYVVVGIIGGLGLGVFIGLMFGPKPQLPPIYVLPNVHTMTPIPKP